jgi:hypothetical protein
MEASDGLQAPASVPPEAGWILESSGRDDDGIDFCPIWESNPSPWALTLLTKLLYWCYLMSLIT